MWTSEALQRGVAVALRTPGLADTPFYDGPPAGARPPYVSIGREKMRFRGWKGGGTMEHRFFVTLFDSCPDHATVKQRLAKVVAAVLKMSRQVGDVRLVTLQLLGTDVKRGKRQWMEGTAEFRAICVEE